MRFFFLIFFLSIGVVFASPIDPIESIINSDQEVSGTTTEEELPAVFLAGDVFGARVSAPEFYTTQPNLICENIELDELVELSRGELKNNEATLNLSLPRVKDAVFQACLVRPGDAIWALGPGWQRELTVKAFVVRKEGGMCPGGSPYSLWVGFHESLDEAPFIYSTDPAIKAEINNYRPLSQLPTATFNFKSPLQWAEPLLFPEEYIFTGYSVFMPNCERIIHVQRRSVSPDDEYLPNEIVYFEREGFIEKLWEEKVDTQKGSGHVRLRGIWDFDGDGLVDLLIEGDHYKCPFLQIFHGTNRGFESADVPNRACGC